MKVTVQRELRKAEKDYVSDILKASLAQKEAKTFWKYMKFKRNDNLGVSPLKENEVLYCDGESKARILSQQLQSVFNRGQDNAAIKLDGASQR